MSVPGVRSCSLLFSFPPEAGCSVRRKATLQAGWSPLANTCGAREFLVGVRSCFLLFLLPPNQPASLKRHTILHAWLSSSRLVMVPVSLEDCPASLRLGTDPRREKREQPRGSGRQLDSIKLSDDEVPAGNNDSLRSGHERLAVSPVKHFKKQA